MELRVRVRQEEGLYWAEVEELPGCFASGETLDVLVEALAESVSLYLEGDSPSFRVEELKVGIGAPQPKLSA